MRLYCLLPCLLLCSGSLSAAEMVIGITNSHKMPWVRLEGDHIRGGLLVEIGHLLAAELGSTARFVMVPRKRVEFLLQAHEIDLICNYRPAWFDEPDKVDWSGPVLRQGDVVVFLRDHGLSVTAEGMKNKRISMTLGYHYPELQQMMADLPYARVDVKYEELTMQQVLNKTTDFAVLNSYMFDWYVHENPRHLFAPATYISTFDFECAISKQAAVSSSSVQQATQGLHQHGQFMALAQKYGLNIPPLAEAQTSPAATPHKPSSRPE